MTNVPLCNVSDVPDGGSAALVADVDGKPVSVMAIRKGDDVFVYENLCPHIGAPLDFPPGQFLSDDGTHIQCATHAALFRIEDGICVEGPCEGDKLRPLAVVIEDGAVFLT